MTKWNQKTPVQARGREKKAAILVAAVQIAERYGFSRMPRSLVAEEAGCSETLVSFYFSTMARLKRDVMRAALREGRLKIIAEGLATGDIHAAKASPDLKQKALATLG